jgi:hypothetical protein
VYELNLWGGKKSEFYSGDGSHTSEIVDPYISVITSFLTSFKNPLVVCDLGCGDFNVGKELVKHAKKYIAVDIVNDLITRNKEKFKAENLEFQCLNLSEDDLPAGDCALVRQVLQHLSNVEVARILRKLEKYQYIMLTEHVPTGSFIPNKDIISGQGIRLKKQSGINVLASPFDFKVKKAKQLLAIVPKDGKGVIVTTLYQIF